MILERLVKIMTEMEMFAKALAFASQKHVDQTRNDGKTPYIYHPIKVAEIVRDAGGDIKMQIAAILHDTLEDTDATEADIKEFGDDVLEAVKLVTRAKGADEMEYVKNILKNNMAATVKNADKIHNVWEAPFCDDKMWAKQYLRKSRRYYYGKFSKALDNLICDSEGVLSIYNPIQKPLRLNEEDLMLYTEKEIILYKQCEALYKTIAKRPDFTKQEIQFWYNDIGRYYFCIVDDKVWNLGKMGWVPCQTNPIDESEYGENLNQVNRDEVVRFIERGKNNNYFYDFVELELL